MLKYSRSVILVLVFAFIAPLCLGASGMREVYTCGEASEFICINADGYGSEDPSAEFILGDYPSKLPLTRAIGCEMLLRAFGPLPDVQEGVRDYVKYRDCAFTDVPEESRAAVENLTNAGLYIPEDNDVFGPERLMSENDLYLLLDRIHAYLQSNLKDDYYSYVTADLLNDPSFLDVPKDIPYFVNNMEDPEKHFMWMMNMFNECLENPDTPEKANIAAFISTYSDMDARENCRSEIKAMTDAIWNAPDFSALTDVCADICKKTGIELIFSRGSLFSWESEVDMGPDGKVTEIVKNSIVTEDFEDYISEESYTYQATKEQYEKLFTLLGYEKEEVSAAIVNYMKGIMYEGSVQYNNSELSKDYYTLYLDNIPDELAFFPFSEYLERAEYNNRGFIALNDYAGFVTWLSVMAEPDNLSGTKVRIIKYLIENLRPALPLDILDAHMGFWDAYYAANPSMLFAMENLDYLALPLISADVFTYFSKTEEYRVLKETFETIFDQIKEKYSNMMEKQDWLDDSTRLRALKKIDEMGAEILIPSTLDNMLHAEYVSSDEGGTILENIFRYNKERRKWINSDSCNSWIDYFWSALNPWLVTNVYYRPYNKLFMTMSGFVANNISKDSQIEEILARDGVIFAHEVSHGFDYGGSSFNEKGEMEEWWTDKDMEEFTKRCERVSEYMDGYEIIPGIAAYDGKQLVDESIADMTSLKCMMEMASDIENFDYELFFSTYANLFAVSPTRKGAVQFFVGDEHPNGRVRINKIISLLDEFYEIYDIQEGDAMYVAPEDRPYVW
ncbi:MAG: hypothetical protein K6F82_06975 [Sphaerochaetaceae bacterium]|nr:hypothetical protein [Sphaerochaetaceae bacterium]